MLGAGMGKIDAVMRGRVRPAGLALLAAGCVVTTVLVSSGGSAVARRTPAQDARRPNIVFVLTDDLSINLLRYMPHVHEMMRRGLTFSHYFVSDSLCCPSRASIFTGNFPHDTKVFGNSGRRGGFNVFHARGEERDTFAVALRRAGYRTAMMGKYLNGYLQRTQVPDTYMPPGWSDWNVAGWGYGEFDYVLNQNGSLYAYGHQPADYLTDVISQKGARFIDRSAAVRQPFFLELATFAPHRPAIPAPRDAERFPGLKAPQPGNFDVLPTDAPRWLVGRAPLSESQIAEINRTFRSRAQSVQSVDDMIGAIEQRVEADGIADNTYLVFSSDNGFHTGQYRLMPGKLTAFDTDIRVPLVIVGPGIPAGVRTGALAENVDLAETFAAIAGTKLSADGHSLVPLFTGHVPSGWRRVVLIEHHGTDLQGIDPDFQQSASGSPRTYEAMRSRRFLYVEYNDGESELYDLRHDPLELHNIAASVGPTGRGRLHAELGALAHCHGAAECWRAGGL
ncbi:MAG: sulfatase family protein [Solirubrobacteraceae bacterium]